MINTKGSVMNDNNYYNRCGWHIMQDKRGTWLAWEPGKREPRKFFSLSLALEHAEREPKIAED